MSAERCYHNIERCIGNTTWVRNIPALLLHKRSKHHSQPQISGHNIQMIKKDVAKLSQWLQCILLGTHQYNVCILYKSDPDLYIANWLLKKNHTENKDKEIKGMTLSIDTIKTMMDIPFCISIHDMQKATQNDMHLQELKEHIIKGWPSYRNEIRQDMRDSGMSWHLLMNWP